MFIIHTCKSTVLSVQLEKRVHLDGVPAELVQADNIALRGPIAETVAKDDTAHPGGVHVGHARKVFFPTEIGTRAVKAVPQVTFRTKVGKVPVKLPLEDTTKSTVKIRDHVQEEHTVLVMGFLAAINVQRVQLATIVALLGEGLLMENAMLVATVGPVRSHRTAVMIALLENIAPKGRLKEMRRTVEMLGNIVQKEALNQRMLVMVTTQLRKAHQLPDVKGNRSVPPAFTASMEEGMNAKNAITVLKTDKLNPLVVVVAKMALGVRLEAHLQERGCVQAMTLANIA